MPEGRMERMGYTGKFFESDNFGECLSRQSGYKPYHESIDVVKNNQPWDTTDPKPRFANNLHYEVAQELGLSDAQLSDLHFYTAVGSVLDQYHGVDGFFEYEDARVTLDISKNPAKESGYKADFMVGPEHVEYEKRRQELALDIADELQRRFAEQRRPKPRRPMQPVLK